MRSISFQFNHWNHKMMIINRIDINLKFIHTWGLNGELRIRKYAKRTKTYVRMCRLLAKNDDKTRFNISYFLASSLTQCIDDPIFVLQGIYDSIGSLLAPISPSMFCYLLASFAPCSSPFKPQVWINLRFMSILFIIIILWF